MIHVLMTHGRYPEVYCYCKNPQRLSNFEYHRAAVLTLWSAAIHVWWSASKAYSIYLVFRMKYVGRKKLALFNFILFQSLQGNQTIT